MKLFRKLSKKRLAVLIVFLIFVLGGIGLLSWATLTGKIKPLADVSQSERQITTNPNTQIYPAIWGNKIVYWDARNGNWDIYLYDLTTNTERQITTNPADQTTPAIWGNKIVYADNRNGNDDIYLYDLTTNTERQITTNPANQTTPAIWENKIVWTDLRNRNYDIYLYTLPPTFEDVPVTYWAWESIENIYQAGFTSGCRVDSSTGKLWFCPENYVTRGQMAFFLAKAKGLPDYTGPQIFSDVPATHLYFKQIGAIYQAGITSGCGVGRYCPADNITRGQTAAMVAKAKGLPDYTGPQIFSDVPTTHPFFKLIGAFYKAKITVGCEVDKFCPDQNLKRAPMAVFLDRAFISNQ